MLVGTVKYLENKDRDQLAIKAMICATYYDGYRDGIGDGDHAEKMHFTDLRDIMLYHARVAVRI